MLSWASTKDGPNSDVRAVNARTMSDVGVHRWFCFGVLLIYVIPEFKLCSLINRTIGQFHVDWSRRRHRVSFSLFDAAGYWVGAGGHLSRSFLSNDPAIEVVDNTPSLRIVFDVAHPCELNGI